MLNKTWIWTSLVAALSTVIGLQFLKLFNFINWSPIGWSKKWMLFQTAHFTIKWALLFVALTILFALLYILVSFTTSIPPSITSILVVVILVFLVEWSIQSPKTPLEAIKATSVPFLAMMAITTRFITGTAVFMRKLSTESMK